ncbi:TPA: hypothetical protein QDB15_000084 [Burkholderia vietnamiensis]|uniref:Uncharacterized protein n=1 Tax=Pandoraea apista TaxID=93218 RepID=A0A5E5P1E0_9BURK|nr:MULTISPECIES: hypothetical protein [Burkholderiaceae]MCA8206358.1 hypothetical protein [Burkholderia vietnamiensis]VVG70371.1 hypothetical protein PAP18089_01331 [Pandoraea apista]HDR8943156.1 hypothetical protein [Burkholderia vietnamiensis]HDR9116360.1 hypothetical protein [Burkholderia vietnamiensis]HDR9205406.1 hypothetical protein [Burkholderia vietnamiensis]
MKQRSGKTMEKLITTADAAKPAPTSFERFVLPDVMRNWPILDDRDRVPSPPAYGAYAD